MNATGESCVNEHLPQAHVLADELAGAGAIILGIVGDGPNFFLRALFRSAIPLIAVLVLSELGRRQRAMLNMSYVLGMAQRLGRFLVPFFSYSDSALYQVNLQVSSSEAFFKNKHSRSPVERRIKNSN